MAEKKKIELIKLTIQIGDSKVQVTKDEARDLYNALADMFQVKTKTETVYVDRYRPWSWPYWSSTTLNASDHLQQGISEGAQLDYKYSPQFDSAGNEFQKVLTHDAGTVKLSVSDYKLSDI